MFRRAESILSVSSLLDRFLRHIKTYIITVKPDSFQYPRCWIVSSDSFSRLPVDTVEFAFSILAVGSFPQTLRRAWLSGADLAFQYPRCWIVSSDFSPGVPATCVNAFQYPRCWIVSSDSCNFAPRKPALRFQYPRCWIVSSDTIHLVR